MSEVLAYTAGLIDGEGYIGIVKRHRPDFHGRRYHQPTVKLVSTDEGMVDWMLQFGGYKYRRKPTTTNRNPTWWWELRGWIQIEPFLRQISPWLRTKAEHAVVMAEFFASPKGKGRVRLSEEVLAGRERLYLRLRQLNRRGPPPAETKREDAQEEGSVTADMFQQHFLEPVFAASKDISVGDVIHIPRLGRYDSPASREQEP
jgi:hypothetical protein